MMEKDGELSPEEAAIAVDKEDKATAAEAGKENINPLATETAAPLPTGLKEVDVNTTSQLTNEDTAPQVQN